jgi:hypothetical protein
MILVSRDFQKTSTGSSQRGLKSSCNGQAQRGHISEQKFFASTAKLIGYGYSFTSPSLPALIAAAEISDWDKARWPLSRALDQLGTDSIQLRDAASLTVPFLERIYRESILDERRRALTWALMDQIGKRSGGIPMVQAIKRAVPSAFGVNVLGADAAVSTIDAWLKNRPIRLVD